MPLDITIPQLENIKRSAKDLIISVLMFEHPQNLTKLTKNIKSKFHAPVTFQGIRKAVNQLVENKIVIKNNKDYSLSKDWILKLREFAEKLQESYFEENTGLKNIEAIGEDLKVYTFDNLIDLDKFWNKIMDKWFEDDKKSKHKKYYIQQSGHAWYYLGQLEKETYILDKMIKHKIQFNTLSVGNTFLDKWAKKYYGNQGFFYTTSKKQGDTSKYFAVYNDYIIQTEYPKELNNQIDKIYKDTKKLEDLDITKLIKVLRKKVELKITVMKNPVIAEQLRNFVLSHFKK